MVAVSRDRTRANRVGITLDQAKHMKESESSKYLEQQLSSFRSKRKSVDATQAVQSMDKRRASIIKNLKLQKLGQTLGSRKHSYSQIDGNLQGSHSKQSLMPNLSG